MTASPAATDVSVSATSCQGMGLCQAMAPSLFTLDEDGFAEVVRDRLDDAVDIELAQAVAECCPLAAIRIEIATPSPRTGLEHA